MRWYDIRHTIDRWRVFNIFMGGRGIGKTYSAIDYCVGSGKKFLYVRSTERQIKISLSPDKGNPFKRWAKNHDRHIYIRSGEDVNDIVETVTGDDGKEDRLLGYACALSTFENLRGVDFSDIDIILYDEFIQVQPLRFDAFRAFLNMYESVNRNRELSGDPPVPVFFLANTQELNNPILSGFGLIGDIETLKRTGQKRLRRGDIYVELCDSSVSRQKENTVLYRNLPDDDNYKREALKNEFARNDFTGIGKPRALREYRPLCMVDDITIYGHKSRRAFYVAAAMSNKVPTFNSSNQTGLFYRTYGGALTDAYARNTLMCDSFLTRQKILNILHI